MLINGSERQRQLGRAQEEISRYRLRIPGQAHYTAKLQDLWERARHSQAYRELGRFSTTTFSALPITTKSMVKAEPWKYTTTRLGDAAKYYETSGTTGRATPTPRLAEDIIWNTVSVAEAWRDVLPADDRGLILLPSDVVPVADLIAGVYEYLERTHTRSYPFTQGVCDWDRLSGIWASLRPATLFLSPGVALQLTRLFKQRDALGDLAPSVRNLMLLGEVSTPSLRRRLGAQWQASVYDASYGSTETGTLAAACQEDRQHLLTTANYFELAAGDSVTPLTGNGDGRLVVTPLNLFARPLLRLDTGDEVTISHGCACGNDAPVVTVAGRSSDEIAVHGTPLSVRAIEEIVYGVTGATGYVIEASPEGDYARLLLERDVRWERGDEIGITATVQRSSERDLRFRWDDVVFVNTLPAVTKSGASQKNWKRSNLRLLEAR